MADRLHLTIGEVLSLLREEFPDVSISKIRFLESQGLVNPERTPSGYRKFYDQDVERLRWILRQQREHFLPLKVIRGRLTGQDGEVAEHDEGDDHGGPAPAGSDDAGHEQANRHALDSLTPELLGVGADPASHHTVASPAPIAAMVAASSNPDESRALGRTTSTASPSDPVPVPQVPTATVPSPAVPTTTVPPTTTAPPTTAPPTTAPSDRRPSDRRPSTTAPPTTGPSRSGSPTSAGGTSAATTPSGTPPTPRGSKATPAPAAPRSRRPSLDPPARAATAAANRTCTRCGSWPTRWAAPPS